MLIQKMRFENITPISLSHSMKQHKWAGVKFYCCFVAMHKTGEGGVIIYQNLHDMCFEWPISRKSENNDDVLNFQNMF